MEYWGLKSSQGAKMSYIDCTRWYQSLPYARTIHTAPEAMVFPDLYGFCQKMRFSGNKTGIEHAIHIRLCSNLGNHVFKSYRGPPDQKV